MKKVNFVTKNSLNGGQTGPRMTITEDGKVGIGTEAPSKVLDVSGDINFTGTLYQNGSAFSSGGGGGGGSSISSISELTDVNLAGITTDQGVKWDGSKLVPTTLSSGGGGSSISNISELTDVDLSGITTDQGVKWDGSKLVPTTLPTSISVTKKGQVLETLVGYCDGSTVTVDSGTYTMPTQTLANLYVFPTTHTKDPASEITYTAPLGTERLLYKYIGHFESHDGNGLIDYKLYIDDVEASSVTNYYRDGSAHVGAITFYCIIKNTDSLDLTQSHKYEIRIRSLTTDHEMKARTDAGLPQLEIVAIGEETTSGVSSGGGGSGGVSNGSDVSFNNLDISGVLATNKSNNQISLGAHIIPTQNAQFDLGNAEYKIRHLFLSDNSLWLGDDHKMDIADGKIKFKKRDKTKVPKGIKNAYGEDDAAVKTKLVALWNTTPELKDGGYGDSGTGDIDANTFGNFKLHDWEKLAHHLQTQTGGNFPTNPYNPGEIDTIMGMDDPDYFEEEIGGGPKYHYAVINGGSSDYKFSGPGVLGNESNPTMTFYKGSTYILKVNATGHPFWIKTADSTGTSNAVSADWVKNNGVDVGEIVFTVPMNAPAQYHYNCQLHAAMHGVINIA